MIANWSEWGRLAACRPACMLQPGVPACNPTSQFGRCFRSGAEKKKERKKEKKRKHAPQARVKRQEMEENLNEINYCTWVAMRHV